VNPPGARARASAADSAARIRGLFRSIPAILPVPLGGQQIPQPLLIDRPAGQSVIQRAMATPEHRLQRQLHQRGDRPVGADRRLSQLEQRIGPGGQALIDPGAEPGQSGQLLDVCGVVHHTHLYGLRAIG
jgi:hypothetical protein